MILKNIRTYLAMYKATNSRCYGHKAEKLMNEFRALPEETRKKLIAQEKVEDVVSKIMKTCGILQMSDEELSETLLMGSMKYAV